ncbi:MAG TPA: pentapeptide repeat-containing protein, partial [Solirubrobacteraceae bacterium]
MPQGEASRSNFADETLAAGTTFGRSAFPEGANFRNTVFAGDVSFVGAQADGLMDFTGARFSGRAFFGQARFESGITFDDATFDGTVVFGPVHPGPPDPKNVARLGGPVVALGVLPRVLGRRDWKPMWAATTAEAIRFDPGGDSHDPLGRIPKPNSTGQLADLVVGDRSGTWFAEVVRDGIEVSPLGPRIDIQSGVRCTALAAGVVHEQGSDVPLVAAGFEDGRVRVYRALSGEPVQYGRMQHDGAVTCVAILSDAPYVISGGRDRKLRQATLTPIDLGVVPTAIDGALRRGEQLAVVGGKDGTVAVLALAAGTHRVESIGGHEGSVTAVAFAPARADDDLVFVTGGEDGVVRSWSARASAGLQFGASASLRRAVFREHLHLAGCLAPEGTLDLSDCSVGGELIVADVSVRALRLDRARVDHRILLRRVAATRGLEMRRLAAGGVVTFEDCTAGLVSLDGVVLPEGVAISQSRMGDGLALAGARLGRSRLSGRRDEPLVILSLAGATLQAPVTLQRVDMRACSLGGAAGLDELVLASAIFRDPPTRVASGRLRITDELGWRARTTRWSRLQIALGSTRVRQRDREVAGQVALLYRQLRKAQEDSKNEPGAADFYYGEMEMRKFSDRRPVRLLIGLYWLVSGYALRPLRSL